MTKLSEVLMPDHPVYEDAVEAMRCYNEARDAGASAEEVERLRLVAEASFQAVTDYQLRAFGLPGSSVH